MGKKLRLGLADRFYRPFNPTLKGSCFVNKFHRECNVPCVFNMDSFELNVDEIDVPKQFNNEIIQHNDIDIVIIRSSVGSMEEINT